MPLQRMLSDPMQQALRSTVLPDGARSQMHPETHRRGFQNQRLRESQLAFADFLQAASVQEHEVLHVFGYPSVSESVLQREYMVWQLII